MYSYFGEGTHTPLLTGGTQHTGCMWSAVPFPPWVLSPSLTPVPSSRWFWGNTLFISGPTAGGVKTPSHCISFRRNITCSISVTDHVCLCRCLVTETSLAFWSCLHICLFSFSLLFVIPFDKIQFKGELSLSFHIGLQQTWWKELKSNLI